MGGLSLLQWIFLTQESNLGLLHCRGMLYLLSYKGNAEYRLENCPELTLASEIFSVITEDLQDGLGLNPSK